MCRHANRPRSSVLQATLSCCGALTLFASAAVFGAPVSSDLTRMSLQELTNVEVTSVSKSNEALRSAPATIYVITREDIVRSGVTNIPEALRLAPNIEIRQQNSHNYSGAARGFGGNPDAQNFSNKLLILIDGRSVYSPLFSGVYFDAQDVFMEDIERIEVISGPGATLWGANAMNGVINIITRKAADTHGGIVTLGGGTLEKNVGARFGGSSGNFDYRFYGKGFDRGPMEFADGSNAEDDWRMAQAGARLDWSHGVNAFTAQTDAYRALENDGLLDQVIEGANALTRWQHRGERSDLRVQAYFDHTERSQPPGGVAFIFHTYDLEVQDTFTIGSRHKVIVGAGERSNRYTITNGPSLLFVPASRTLNIGNLFAQDTIALSDRLQLSMGIKLEEDPFAGWELLPDVRFSWQIGETAMAWASGARAIRSPTPFDHDVVEKANGMVFLTGDPAFAPEDVNAYEIGYRAQPYSRLTFSASAFYNEYDHLRTVEPASPTVFLPLRWDNLIRGSTYGVEAWAKWQAMENWRISPGVRWLRKHLEFAPGASALLPVGQSGNDPSLQASLASSWTFPRNLTVDLFLRYVGALPAPALDAYTELNAHVGWRATESLEIGVSGFNLLHSRHRESPILTDPEIVRSVFAEARWRF